MAKNESTSNTHAAEAEELDQIYRSVMSCEPALAPDQLDRVAKMATDQEVTGIPWRLAAFIASQGGDFYEGLAKDPEKARSLAHAVMPLQNFAERMRGIASLAECAATRLMVAGCSHEDFNKWTTEEVD